MIQTTKIECPKCNIIQKESIDDLIINNKDMEGSLSHICDSCNEEFTIEFEFKPFMGILLYLNFTIF